MGQKDLPGGALGQENLPGGSVGNEDLPGGAMGQKDPREAACPSQGAVVVVDVSRLRVNDFVKIIANGEYALVCPGHQLGEARATRSGPDVRQVMRCHVSHVALTSLIEQLQESLVLALCLPVHFKHSLQGRQNREIHLSVDNTRNSGSSFPPRKRANGIEPVLFCVAWTAVAASQITRKGSAGSLKKMADLSDAEMARLIEFYQSQENLYNINTREYHDRDKQRKSYLYIAAVMGKGWDGKYSFTVPT